MQEQLDKLYKEYFYEKLDLIFGIDRKKTDDTKENDKNNENKQLPAVKWERKNGNQVFYLSTQKDNPKIYQHICRYSCDGYAIVVNWNNGYNLFDVDGNLVFDSWFYYIDTEGVDEYRRYVFPGGFAKVENEERKWNFVDKKGKLISDTWFKAIYTFHGGVAVVQNDNNEYNIIDDKGNLLFNKWLKKYPKEAEKAKRVGKMSVFQMGNKTITHCSDGYLGEYQVEKHITGYKLIGPNDSFTMKYVPIRVYCSRFVLCYNKGNMFLYDKLNKSYMELGNISSIDFNDNFIIKNGVRIEEKVLFFYNDSVIDITSYYSHYLKNKNAEIKCDTTIMSKEDFLIGNEEEIKARYKAAKEEDARISEKVKREFDKRQVEMAKLRQEATEQELETKKEKDIRSLAEAISKVRQRERKTGIVERFDFGDITFDCGDHREIHPLYLGMGLKNVDLRNLDLRELKVSGIDFSESNIIIGKEDPQLVYNRDLSNCNFEGVSFLTNTNFNGVNIKGSKFTRGTNSSVIGIHEELFIGAIYDETTTLDGVPLTELLHEKSRRV